MKEKTFEELIDQYSYRGNYISSEKVVGEEAVLELMQQVREATIAECANIELDSYSSVETQRRFDKLPTDRMKLTQ